MATKDESINYFYDIEVISYDGKRRAVLTDKIKRLIESVEIQETQASGNNDSGLGNSLTIVMREMSYLPEDGGLRPQAPDVFGQITNRPASIVDLRFDTEKGYTFVSKAEIESGTTSASRNQFGREEPVIFLFQNRNKIRITWGLLEPYSSRTEEYEMQIITTEGGSTDNGRVVIQALNRELELNRARPENGITFIVDPNNNIDPGEVGPFPLEPLSLKQTLYKVSTALNLKLIFDNEEVNRYPVGTDKYDVRRTEQADSAPPDKPFRITAKITYMEFVRQLASDFQSYVNIREIDGEQYLVFNRSDLVFGDSVRTFRYRDKDGVVLSYQISDQSGMYDSPTTASSVTETGINKKREMVVEQLAKDDTKKPKQFDTDNNQKHENELGKARVGSSDAIPTENQDKLDNYVQAKSYERSYFNKLSLVTVGDPLFETGNYIIENIGARYTGTYKMFGVKHIMNTSGYTVQFQGKRQEISEGGVGSKSQESESVQEESTNEQLAIDDTNN